MGIVCSNEEKKIVFGIIRMIIIKEKRNTCLIVSIGTADCL